MLKKMGGSGNPAILSWILYKGLIISLLFSVFWCSCVRRVQNLLRGRQEGQAAQVNYKFDGSIPAPNCHAETCLDVLSPLIHGS